METGLEKSFFELFMARRFGDISRLAEEMAVRRPDDMEYRYCAAIAYISNGEQEKGLSRLWGALARYTDPSLLSGLARENKSFVTEAALQLAQLAEFYSTKINRDAAFRCSNFAAGFARSLARELGDEETGRQAAAILGRHHSWRYRSLEGQEFGGSCSIPDSPHVLQIEPTNLCNLKCRMCPHESLQRHKGVMEKSVFQDILAGWSNRRKEISLKHLVHKNVKIEDSILGLVKLFFMGEPLLHPEFDFLISYAQSQGVKVGLQTNGVLLSNADIRRRLLRARPYEIGISLDGISDQTYEAVRQGARWKDICQSLENFWRERKESGLEAFTRVYITTIVTEDYRKSQELSLAFLTPVRPFVDGVVYNLLNKSSKGGFFDLNGNLVAYAESPFRYRLSESSPLCEEALYKLNVLWDGTITACCYDIEGSMQLGDWRQGVDAAWRSEAAVRLREAILTGQLSGYSLCGECKGLLNAVH